MGEEVPGRRSDGQRDAGRPDNTTDRNGGEPDEELFADELRSEASGDEIVPGPPTEARAAAAAGVAEGEPVEATPGMAPAEPARAEPVATASGRGGDGPRPGAAHRRPFIERFGLALIAIVLAALFGAVALAAWNGGELFLAAMGAVGFLMTVWVGSLTLFRG